MTGPARGSDPEDLQKYLSGLVAPLDSNTPAGRKAVSFLVRLGVEVRLQASLATFTDHLLRLLSETVGYGSVSLYFHQADSAELMLVAALGTRRLRVGERVSGSEVWGEAAAGQTVRAIPDASAASEARGAGSLLLIPLAVEGKVQAMLVVDDERQGAFSGEDITLAQVIRPHLAMKLREARLYEAAQQASTRDPLTGARNRRYFSDALEQEIARSRRYGYSFTLALIDVNGLKAANDTYGHLMGDQVLVALARLLTDNLRASDVVARYGGDEFVALLPQTQKVAGQLVMKRVMGRLDEASVTCGSAVIAFPARSWGLAAYPEDGATADELVAAADREMYRSRGR